MLISLILLVTLIISGCGYSNKAENSEKALMPATHAPVTTAAPTKKPISIEDNFTSVSYLDRDDLFLLTTKTGEKYVTDANGNAQRLKDAKLKSLYLYTATDMEGRTAAMASPDILYDIYGNDLTNHFVKDEAHEKLLGVCKMEDKDVVWVRRREETPEASRVIFTAYNEAEEPIVQFDSNNPNINKKSSNWLDKLLNASHARYIGSNVCMIETLCINVDTQEIFEADGEPFTKFRKGEGEAKFIDGYAVVNQNVGHNIRDVHGNYLYSKDGEDILDDALPYSCGLFFNKETQKFYDVNLNEKIDLSQYKAVTAVSDYDDKPMFIDGYCGIVVYNDAGTQFFGIIDTNGNWVMELTDTVSEWWNGYSRKISDNTLQLSGGKIYNIQTKTVSDDPRKDFNRNNNDIIVDGTLYYVNNGKFNSYDYDNKVGDVISVNVTA